MIELEAGQLGLCTLYACLIWQTSKDVRVAVGQPNRDINYKQDREGKACECIARNKGKSMGRKLKGPDFKIYPPHQKHFGPDLVAEDGGPDIHVKKITWIDGKGSVVFAKTDRKLFNDKNGEVWCVNLLEANGTYIGEVLAIFPAIKAGLYTKALKNKELLNKCAVYLDDLPAEYRDIPDTWEAT